MLLKAHSVLVDNKVLEQYPELGSVFAYLASSLGSIVAVAKDAPEILESVDNLVSTALGGPFLKTCFTDLNREEISPTDLPEDVCLLLTENSKYTLH